jgi:thiamine biosynthesis lipoprotein
MAENLTGGLFKLKFQALGTVCEVQYRTESVEAAKEYRKVALDWLRDFEEKWSRFKPESLLCEINAKAGKSRVEISEEDEETLRLCEYAYGVSEGLNDATSFPVTALWDDAGKKDCLPGEAEIEAARKLVSWPSVEWGDGKVFLPERGMALEIGGFGKEYAVDRLVGFAKQFEIRDCLVDLGRDVAAIGEPPHGRSWVLGIEDAREGNAVAYRLAISGKGLATSGNGRRFRMIGGRKFGHIIDMRSGWPAENEVITASCLADDCLTAGLFSTNACIVGSTKGMEAIERKFGVEAILQGSSETLSSSQIHHYVLRS